MKKSHHLLSGIKSAYIIKSVAVILFITLWSASGSAQLSFISFAPASGAVGTTVSITGSRFNATASNNIVYFGSVKATVTGGNATSLTVIVPVGATHQPISVTNTATRLTWYSKKPFIVTFAGGAEFNFAYKIDTACGNSASGISIADLDGDGKSDLAIANYGWWTPEKKVSVLRNAGTSGTISMLPKETFTTGDGAYNLATGDIDGDGKLDIVTANQGAGSFSVLQNTGAPGNLLFAAKKDFSIGTLNNDYGNIGINVADIDMDGKPDIAVTRTGSGEVSIFRNTTVNGVISFAAKIDFTAGEHINRVCIADIDGDGRPEMIATSGYYQNGTYLYNYISIYRNNSSPGDVNYYTRIIVNAGLNPMGIAIGDIDNDGKIDMVIANQWQHTISVFRNITPLGSAISFAAKTDYASGSLPYAVCLTDLNGDGKLDIAVANSASNTVSLFKNTSTSGTISLAGKIDYTIRDNSQSIAIGDLDNDGRPDLAITSLDNNVVSLLRNKCGESIIYYPKTSATDLSQASNWTTDVNGVAGSSPVNFVSNHQLFYLNNNVSNPAINNTWSVSGGSDIILNNTNALIVNTNARISIGAGSSFNLNHKPMLLKANATGRASIGTINGNVLNADNVTAEQYISDRRAWRLLGIPFYTSSQSIKDAWMEGGTNASHNPHPGYGTHITTYTGDYWAYTYDGVKPSASIRIDTNDHFKYTPSSTTTPITRFPSYFLFVRGDRSIDVTSLTAHTATTLRITGTIITGNITTGQGGTNYSLIRNPYLSSIDFDAVKALPANSDINRFYVWDASLGSIGQYRTIDVSGTAPNYTYTAIPGGTNNNWRFIEPGTAFFVPGRRRVDFTEATKTTGAPPSSMLRTVAGTETALGINLNKINADNAVSLADGVKLVFDNMYAGSVDNNDAKKIPGFDLNFGILNNKEVLSIEKRPLPNQDDVIPLSLSQTVPGRYLFDVQPANYPGTLVPYVRDKFLNTYTEISLTADTKVEFSITTDAASSATDRFSIVFKKPAINVKPAIVIYPNPVSNGAITVQLNNTPKGTYLVRLVNALGQTILTHQVEHAGGNSSKTIGVNRIKGTYSLEIVKPDNSKQTNKVVIN